MRVSVEEQEGATDAFEVSFRWATNSAELQSASRPAGRAVDSVNEWAASRRDYVLSAKIRGRKGAVGPHTSLRVARLELEELTAVAETAPGVPLRWVDPPEGVALPDANWLSDVAMALTRRVRYIAPRRVEQGPRSLQPSAVLEPDARNLAEVLFTLRSNYVTTKFAATRRAMKRAFPEIVDLTVWLDERQPGGTVGEPAISYRNDPSHLVPLRLSGSGVEQMLSLVVGILTADDPCVFLIDEPQAYLHPYAERMLLELLDKHPKHQYVIATHSNYLLGARPLSQARLLTTVKGYTRVAAADAHTDLLDTLGLTAADLWLPDHVIWVEGPSEKAVFSVILSQLGAEARGSVRIHQMPAPASAFTGSPARRGRALFEFCDRVAAAIAPKLPATIFVFDRDEKSTKDRADIMKASQGRAIFLKVRELENLFLDAEIVAPVLNNLLTDIGRASVTTESVDNSLTSLLARHGDKALFPAPPAVGKERLEVRGSALLDALWLDAADAPYDKAKYAGTLARQASITKPVLLKPLEDIVAAALAS
jgi:hypothetical protein